MNYENEDGAFLHDKLNNSENGDLWNNHDYSAPLNINNHIKKPFYKSYLTWVVIAVAESVFESLLPVQMA